MKFLINDSHKRMVIDNQAESSRVNVHINDSIIKVDVYSGCSMFIHDNNLPIVNRNLYDVYYDLNTKSYSVDEVNTSDITALFGSISNIKIDSIKQR